MKFEGLTERQCEIADLLYECETLEEVKYFLDYVLPSEERTSALTLLEMMHQDNYEEAYGVDEAYYEVQLLLHKIYNKNVK